MATDQRIEQALNAIKQGQFDEAKDLLSDILVRQVNHAQARWLFALCLEQQDKPREAVNQLKLLLKHSRKDIKKINQLAQHFLKKSYPLDPVLNAYRKYIDHKPEDTNAVFNYAWYLTRAARYEEALAAYESIMNIDAPGLDEIHLNIANLWMDHLGDHEKAREHIEYVFTLNPRHVGAWHNLGNLFEQRGEREEAARCFNNCLALDPQNESALARLADTQIFENDDNPILARLQATALHSRNSDVHFALGRACDQLQRYDEAWEHLSKANQLDREDYPAFDAEKTETLIGAIAETCDREWLENFQGESHSPVFICGMFRTGSTLLEQMLAAHPAFTAGGESEFFPRLVTYEFPQYPADLDRITPKQLESWRAEHVELAQRISDGSGRMTDKRPDNFLCAGLIKAVLPSAKFIVTERDWRDTAISIFATRLGPKQNYSTRLEDIRHYIALQRQLVDHWAEVMGDDLVRVQYEDLVRDPDKTLRSVLDCLNEEWDDRVMAFQEQEMAVRTASAWQVRQPLSEKSIGRWRNYAEHFEALHGED
jgi:tetratricopeptide (TPR) repeat protein/LPS sulfotransferase NodH